MDITLPNSLCGCSNLTMLEIVGEGRSAGLKGSLPACLSRLSKLEFLKLPRNSLIGRVPALPLDALIEVDLSKNKLSGTFPSVAGPYLRRVLINFNKFSGITSLRSCPNLESRYVD